MQALENQPFNAALSHRIALMSAHSQTAIEFLKLSTQQNPFNIDSWNNLGLTFMKAGLIDQAEDCFNKALLLAPDFSRAHFNLANLFNEKQQVEKAMKHFLEAIESDPGITSAWRNLANIHFRQKNFGKALEIYQSAAIAVPEDLHSQIGIGNCLVELNRNEEAVKHFTTLCKSFSSPLPQFSLGLVREKNRQFPEAAEAYLDAGKKGHEDSLKRILNLHLSGKIELSDNELAESSEKLCIIQNFSDPWTMQVYSSALLNQNKKQEALAILSRARDLALKVSDHRLAEEISANIKEIQKP